jgi:hypothetical protein
VYGCDANADGIFNQTKKNIDDTTFVYIYDVDTMSVSWDGQDLPMHWISYDQVLAYAAFAGLRPMTEFEYEKLCRGPKAPVAGEYAWGSSSIQFLDNPITFDLWSTYVMHNWLAGYEWVGTGREAPNRSLGVNAGTGGHNHSHRAWSWGGWAMNMGGELLRVGCFADTNTNRISSGAGYWGAMNLTDNAYEPCVRVGTDESKTFLGVHGSGYLDQEGYYMAFKDTGGGMNSNPWLLNKGQTSVKIYMLRGVLVYWNRDIGLGGNWNGYWDDNVKIPNGYYAEWAQGTISFRQRSGGYDHDPHTIADNNKDFLGIRCVRTEDAAE